MKKSIALAFATLGISGFAHAGLLGPSAYSGFVDSPFSGGSFDYFYLEDFEDGAFNTPGVAASTGSVLFPGGFTDSVDADDGTADGNGNGGRSWYVNQTSVTFTFDADALGGAVTHAGLVWTDVGNNTERPEYYSDIVFEAFDLNDVSLGTLSLDDWGDNDAHGGTDEDRFFGVTNAAGISRIVLSMPYSTDWEMDHLQYGRAEAVPEPASVTLLGLGALGILRRRKTRIE